MSGHPWSRQPSFQIENLENLFVEDGTVAEIAVLAEQFPVVGHDHEIGVFRAAVHELAHHLVQMFDAGDLFLVEAAELIGRKEVALLAVLEEIRGVLQEIVQVLEHAMHAADVRQVFTGFAG